ncbi:MAG: porin family protein [Muribaculaceae bacterium]|nr:porin family protein [Muribaculaceae bacterium]MDE6135619.1 porin family protein [Muribaculaceae bacterium]
MSLFPIKQLAGLVLATTAVLTALPAAGQCVRGEKTFGVRAGYVSRNNTASGGIAFSYAFSRHVRIAPAADIFFRNKDQDALSVSVDMHFPFRAGSDRASFYPLAGVNYISWGRHGKDAESNKDVTNHTNCFGLDAGCGFEFRATGSLKLSLEARYTLIKHFPTAQVAAGIAYVF